MNPHRMDFPDLPHLSKKSIRILFRFWSWTMGRPSLLPMERTRSNLLLTARAWLSSGDVGLFQGRRLEILSMPAWYRKAPGAFTGKLSQGWSRLSHLSH